MVIRPSSTKASHFDIHEISLQELKNILEAFEHTAPPWRFRSPWGSWIREKLRLAIAAEKEYHFTSW